MGEATGWLREEKSVPRYAGTLLPPAPRWARAAFATPVPWPALYLHPCSSLSLPSPNNTKFRGHEVIEEAVRVHAHGDDARDGDAGRLEDHLERRRVRPRQAYCAADGEGAEEEGKAREITTCRRHIPCQPRTEPVAVLAAPLFPLSG